MLVARTWHRTGLEPHRLDRYTRSTDPPFEEKASDIPGAISAAPAACGGVLCRRKNRDLTPRDISRNLRNDR